MASLIQGIKILLAMNPGTSLLSTVCLPIFSANKLVLVYVSSDVCRARIISTYLLHWFLINTSFMIGTGFMKCIPMKFWGFDTLEANLVKEMLEVLEASIMSCSLPCSTKSLSISLNIADFRE